MPVKRTKLRRSAREGTGLTLIDAPWRHEYFDAPKDATCFICHAFSDTPRNDAKNLLLVRGQSAVILLNRYPYTMGALMIAPVAHLARFQDIPDGTLLEMVHLIRHGIAIIDKGLKPKGYNIGVNQGVEAGAGLSDHLHIHLVPRWGADTNFMTTTGQARILAQDVDSMFERLQHARQELESGQAVTDQA